MGIIWTILIGFVAGLIARAIMPGIQAMGFFLTAVLGIAGSLAATYLGQAMGWYAAGAGPSPRFSRIVRPSMKLPQKVRSQYSCSIAPRTDFGILQSYAMPGLLFTPTSCGTLGV